MRTSSASCSARSSRTRSATSSMASAVMRRSGPSLALTKARASNAGRRTTTMNRCTALRPLPHVVCRAPCTPHYGRRPGRRCCHRRLSMRAPGAGPLATCASCIVSFFHEFQQALRDHCPARRRLTALSKLTPRERPAPRAAGSRGSAAAVRRPVQLLR